ncbi:hypothetical protein [Chelativorans intermedius]|uniref:Uncharacterized protein n=1 Tax=Chelativorans intermedius TaxID=515947 RepID=A0ABV6DDI3_9HYPH|nr:hypothetical protein [Chelativorans intermedius]MCT9000703.1 hypothetical protein [Chelativorans intermedius]
MSIPWKAIAVRFGWRAVFEMEGAHPRLIIHHKRHRHRFTGADAWKHAVFVSIRKPRFNNLARRFNR